MIRPNLHFRDIVYLLLIIILSIIGTYIGAQELFYKFLLLFLMTICVVKGLKEENYVNPFLLFIITPFSLLIYSSGVSDVYLSELKPSTYNFVIVNITALIIAFVCTKKRSRISNIDFSGANLVVHAWLLFALGKLTLVTDAIIGETFLNALLPFLSYAGLMCILKSKKKLSILLMYVITIILMINKINKTGFLFLMIVTLTGISKYYILTEKAKKSLIPLGIVCILLMILVFDYRDYVREGGDFLSYLASGFGSGSSAEYYSERINWRFSSSYMLPYMYLTTPWTNLQYVMETQSSRTYGLWLIKPILGWIQLDRYFANFYILVPASSFNTYTFLVCAFKDFGYVFAVVESLFLGFFIKKRYLSYLAKKNPLEATCYAFTAVATIQMFFSNHFFMQSYPFTVVIMLSMYTIVFIKGRRNKKYEIIIS